MRFVNFGKAGNAAQPTLGVRQNGKARVPGREPLESLRARGRGFTRVFKGKGEPGANAQPGGLGDQYLVYQYLVFLPLLQRLFRIVCIGLNYADHTKENQIGQPDYPMVFLRAGASLPGYRPRRSCVRRNPVRSIMKANWPWLLAGADGIIGKEQVLSHVADYALFNDGLAWEYPFKLPQWTVGKNFDGTGAFDPDLVTPDELPAGAKGLHIETRLRNLPEWRNGAIGRYERHDFRRANVDCDELP